MKLLLLLEHHFFRDIKGDVWCERIIDYKYFSRYLSVFDKVYVVARLEYINRINRPMKLASGKGIVFIGLPECVGPKGLIKKSYSIRRILKRQTDIDCIILRAPSPIAMIEYPAVRKLHKPIAVEFVMGADSMLTKKGILSQIGNKIIDNYFKRMCRNVEGVSYVTNHILQQKYPCKYHLKRKGFTESYSSIDLTEESYWRRNWSEDDRPKQVRMIHVGYMDSYRKGQDILIYATYELKRKGVNVKLELIGDGSCRKKLEDLVECLGITNLVEFRGALINKDDIVERLKKAHLYVMPTHKEGLPRGIIEAMAVGLPVISSDVDGIPELIEQKYMVHKFDYLLYADKIANLISDWEEMRRLSERNYNIALNYKKEKLDEKRKKFYLYLKECASSNKEETI